MAKTATVRARVEPELKHHAEQCFSELGLTTTEAITLFYRQVTLHGGLPFAVRLPNAETVEALRDACDGESLTVHADLETLRAELD
ncbi:MAG: type II toxin-antitoxin system RelB/DinJ family antitoxin [bacterium]|nr:type II toxin-antitoxin system RelB/DinJ family antitoxin [bacterium]MCY3924817.1 type II toxin-antitoxin system RelB/DinJ family antitoxin [bacterium]MCY3952533.1 type II toxin-antitoxin system RelB/DinJ family antitoxin [bacterium]MCY4101716.1 type II toxin-antitoxin system RelB/DinJ family antitoxin [bacterium]